MLVLFMTLAWNVCYCRGVVVCIWANLLCFLSRFLYLIRICLCSFLSIVFLDIWPSVLPRVG
jgi:hypothetical protein